MTTADGPVWSLTCGEPKRQPAEGVADPWTWPGPKSAQGPLEAGPAVIRVKPTRNAFGRVTQPARVWLSAQESPRKTPTPADAVIMLPRAFLTLLAVWRPPDVCRRPTVQTRTLHYRPEP